MMVSNLRHLKPMGTVRREILPTTVATDFALQSTVPAVEKREK